MSSIASLQLKTPIAGETIHTSPTTDLLRHNSLAYSAFYSHASLSICNMKLLFSTDGVDFTEYKTITLNNDVKSTGNELIPARYFRFQLENPDLNAMSAIDIYFTAFVNASSNIDVNIGADDIVISGVATEATQLLVKSAVESTNSKITACNTDDVTVSSSVLPAGAATSSLQTSGNTKLTNIETNLTRVVPTDNAVGECLPVRLMVGSSGSAFNALRAIGQDLAVYIDDMNSDVAVNSGLSTKVLQENTKLVIDDIDTGMNKNRSNDTVYTNATVVLNAVSSSIAMGDGKDRYNTIQIIGNSTTALYKFILQYSTDGDNWYSDGAENAVYNNGSEYEFSVSRVNISTPFVRVKSTVAGNSVNMKYSLTKE